MGEIYVKEGMLFQSIETTPLASSDGLEVFSFFFGINGHICIWIHDQIDHTVYLAGKCLNDFLMSFQMSQRKVYKNDLGVVGVKCSDSFLRALQGL